AERAQAGSADDVLSFRGTSADLAAHHALAPVRGVDAQRAPALPPGPVPAYPILLVPRHRRPLRGFGQRPLIRPTSQHLPCSELLSLAAGRRQENGEVVVLLPAERALSAARPKGD